MVPEKTRAAQDETSEEQRSGKTPVREGRRAQRGGSSPGGSGGSREMRALLRLRCSDSLFEWRVRAWGDSGQESVLCVPTRSPICVN